MITKNGMKTAGLILAGGGSRRMSGQHKGSLLTPDGVTFTEHIAAEMRKLTDRIYLSYGDTVREDVQGCVIVHDIYKGCGPVGGLHAALCAAAKDGAETVMTAACDMPCVTSFVYQHLQEQMKNESYDGAVALVNGRIHPLAAIYHVRAAGVFEEQLESGNLKLRDALKKMRILYVEFKGTGLEDMLVNINTEEDYKKMCHVHI